MCLGVQMLPERAGTGVAGWVLRNPLAQYLGAISYCLYLVNEPIHKLAVAALSRFADNDATLFTVLWIPVAIGLPILASIWLHRHLETPALRWGRLAAARSTRR
jgi:peptidoglycan/LPS O-acetylase OafA/YrhL